MAANDNIPYDVTSRRSGIADALGWRDVYFVALDQ